MFSRDQSGGIDQRKWNAESKTSSDALSDQYERNGNGTSVRRGTTSWSYMSGPCYISFKPSHAPSRYERWWRRWPSITHRSTEEFIILGGTWWQRRWCINNDGWKSECTQSTSTALQSIARKQREWRSGSHPNWSDHRQFISHSSREKSITTSQTDFHTPEWIFAANLGQSNSQN